MVPPLRVQTARIVTAPISSQTLSAGLARAEMSFHIILMLTRHSEATYGRATLFPACELSKSRGARTPVDTVVATDKAQSRSNYHDHVARNACASRLASELLWASRLQIRPSVAKSETCGACIVAY